MKIRRFFSLILTAFLMLTFVTSLSAAAEDTTKSQHFSREDGEDETILYEASFDDGSFDGWSAFGGQSTLEINQSHSFDGDSCLMAKDRTAEWSGPAINLTKYVNPGEQIYFEARLQGASNISTTINLTLKITDITGKETFVAVGEIDNMVNQWRRASGTVDIPLDTTDILFYVESPEADLDFYVDHVVIKRSKKVEPTEAPERGENDPEYFFDFEKNLEGWMARGEVEIGINTNYAYSGSNSLYASDRHKTWNGPTVRLDRVLPGKNYTYSAYVYYNGKEYEPEHIFRLELQYIMNGSENYVTVCSKKLQKGTWSNLTGSYTVPEAATDVYLYVQTDYVEDENLVTFNDLMSFYVDNINVIDSSIITKRQLKSTMSKLAVAGAVLVALGVLIVLVVIKSRKTQKALRTASLDFMTKAYNRNAFENLVKEFEADPDQLKKLYITSCDVNFLKYINDNYGHESGDRAIIRCAAVLLRSVSKKGRVFRTGGDEFIVVSPENPLKKINTEFMAESNKYEGYPFSIAVGTVIFEQSVPNEKPDIQKLIAASDQAMYKDKQKIKAEFSQFSGMSMKSGPAVDNDLLEKMRPRSENGSAAETILVVENKPAQEEIPEVVDEPVPEDEPEVEISAENNDESE